MGLDDLVATRDAAVFVARERELGRLLDLLSEDAEHRVAFVSGPAGAGKSALLRELARRAAAAGATPLAVDARELAADGARLDLLLAEAASTPLPLVLIDSAEELGPDERLLRDRALAALPEDARVVLAGRRPPEGAWWRSRWAASLLSLPVGPFDAEAAAEFLAVRGIVDPAEVRGLVGWAEGHALSLTLAAAVRAAGGRPLGPDDLASLDSDLLDHLTSGRLSSPDLLGADRMVLAVAALAPAVDAELLEAVLPGTPGRAAEHWLRGLPFSERLGHRVALHQRVRRLISAQLRRDEPDVERVLRLRAIDHLAEAAQSGRPQLVIDIREVLAPPEDRGVTPSMALASPWRLDTAAPGDVTALRRLCAHEDPSYVDWLVRWVTEAPRHVLVVRHPDRHPAEPGGDLAALALWATADAVPPLAPADPVLAPALARAREWRPDGTLVNPALEVFVDDADAAEVSALLLTSLVQQCGLANFRRWVVPRRGSGPDPAHCGGVPEPALDLRFGETLIGAYVIDYGVAGVIPALREQAHQALAAVPAALMVSTPVGSDSDRVDQVREVLRSFHDPLRLAASPLATGTDPAARVSSVVTLVRAAVAQAFGDGAVAQLQREVLQRGYLDLDASHARAMHALHLSRTTYFRRLREATVTLAAWLDAS